MHPAEFYVALKRPPELFVEGERPCCAGDRSPSSRGRARRAGSPVQVELVAPDVDARAARRAASAYRTTSAHGRQGRRRACGVTTAAAPRAASSTPGRAGYYIVRASAKDRRGNPVAAGAGVYVARRRRGEVAAATATSCTVELVPDRKSYEIGQTAHMLVKSPFKSAEALVTVERAGVYTQRTRDALGRRCRRSTSRSRRTCGPNAFVSVLLVRGRTQGRARAKGGARPTSARPRSASATRRSA